MLTLALLAFLVPASLAGGAGKVFLSVDEALELAFPECVIERTTEVLSELEEKRVETLAHAELGGRLVRPYLARHDGTLVGTAYFDAHRVRSKNEVLMLVVGPDARIRRLEVLAFAEPLDYLPKASFYGQFVGQRLGDDLELDKDIRRVAGATLSAQAATAAARRTLALHQVLAERAEAVPPVVPAR